MCLQQRIMDDATAQQLAAAIQVLAAAAPPPLATGPPPPAPTHISPYEGDALDLCPQTGTSLFQNGCAPLSSKFTGKVDDLHFFLADICNCTQTCHWNDAGHAILSINYGLHVFNVIEDYGKITADQVEAACVMCHAHGADLSMCQNAQMLYESPINSITDEAKAALAMHKLDFHED